MNLEGVLRIFQRFSRRNIRASPLNEDFVKRGQSLYNQIKLLSLPWYRLQLQAFTKNVQILTTHVKTQCKGVVAQRIKRFVQHENCHGHKTIINLLLQIRNSLLKVRRSEFSVIFAATAFSWRENCVTDQEMGRVIEDMAEVQKMQKLHQLDDKEHVHGYLKEWEVVVNTSALKIWRRPLPNSHLYEYKVYGTYNDIPATAFYEVQVDLEYRKQWDSYLVKLEVVDRDPDSKSEMVQWITNFPATWYSREYMFVRRYKIDRDNNVMLVMSRASDHPDCPENDSFVRVKAYSSYMIIKPHTTFDQNGFEYMMTYHDDPQLMYGSVAFKFATSIGVDFVEKIHKAAQALHEKKKKQPHNISNLGTSTIPNSGSYSRVYQ